MREIGSEFWIADTKKSAERCFLSGRTALEYIIRDIKNEHNFESVLLPSWCCHTMIEPFVRNDIKPRFYDVYYDAINGLCADIPKSQENEIFYFMTYFGFSYLQGLDYKQIRESYECIIADETHSWLSKKEYNNFEEMPDYQYTSYRKWTGVYGIASAVKTKGQFSIADSRKANDEYTAMRKAAAESKKRYMNGENIDKKYFLDLYNEAEEMLENDYVDYAPSFEAVEQLSNLDIEFIKKCRIENAQFLLERLAEINGVTPIFDKVASGDVPLFVPVLVNKNSRNSLRKYLIDKNIYCPVHWPISEHHAKISNLATDMYERELSILCDQRYSLDDMKRIVAEIENYYGGRKIDE